jgi:hypothetical protein
VADDFDKATVALRAGIGDHDAIARLLLGTHAPQPEFDHAGESLPETYDSNRADYRAALLNCTVQDRTRRTLARSVYRRKL